MVRQIAALFADEFVVQAAVGYVASSMVRTEGLLLGARILLVRLLVVVLIANAHIVVDLTRVDLLLAHRAMRMHRPVACHLFIHITRPFVVTVVVGVLELAEVARVIHTDTYGSSMDCLLLPGMAILLYKGGRLGL